MGFPGGSCPRKEFFVSLLSPDGQYQFSSASTTVTKCIQDTLLGVFTYVFSFSSHHNTGRLIALFYFIGKTWISHSCIWFIQVSVTAFSFSSPPHLSSFSFITPPPRPPCLFSFLLFPSQIGTSFSTSFFSFLAVYHLTISFSLSISSFFLSLFVTF